MKNSLLFCIVSAILGIARAALADPLSDALDAPGITFSVSNEFGPLPTVDTVISWDGSDAVRLGVDGAPQLSAVITGPTTVYYRARIDHPFNHYVGTMGEWGVAIDNNPPGPWSFENEAEIVPKGNPWLINYEPQWALFQLEVPVGSHRLTWWTRGYGFQSEDQSMWIDRVVVLNQVTAPIFTTTVLQPGTLGRAYVRTLPFLGENVTVSAPNLPPGLALSAAGVLSGTPTALGEFVVVATVTNAHGSDTVPLSFSVLPPLESQIESESRVWTPGGDSTSQWAPCLPAQSQDRIDGLQVAHAEAGTETWLETTLTGPDTLQFFHSNSGTLRVLIDGGVAWSSEGSAMNFQTVSIPAGPHAVRISFVSAGHGSQAILDMVHFESEAKPVITRLVNSFEAQVGVPFSTFVVPNHGATLTATGLPPGLTLVSADQRISGTPTASGSYSVRITASNFTGTTERVFLVEVIPSLAALLDAPGMIWTTNGGFAPSAFGVGGNSVACLGGIGSLQTTVTGPDTMVFAAQMIGDGGVTAYLDGVALTPMSGPFDWTDETISIPPGEHTVLFSCTYSHVWIDHVRLLSQTGINPLQHGPRLVFLDRNQPLDHPLPASSAGIFGIVSGNLPAGVTLDAGSGRLVGNSPIPSISSARIGFTNGAGTHERTYTFIVMDNPKPALAPQADLNLSFRADSMHFGDHTRIELSQLAEHSLAPSRDGLALRLAGSSRLWLEVTGPDTLSFDWRSDALAFPSFSLDDGVRKYFGHHYPLGSWQSETLAIPAGTHRVEWESVTSALLLDRIHLASSGQPRLLGPQRRYFTVGRAIDENLNLGVGTLALASGSLPAGLSLDATGQLTGTPMNPTSTTLMLSLTTAAGSDTANFEFIIVPSLADAVEQPSLTFTTGGTGRGESGFFSQYATSFDGDAALSPALEFLPDTSWLETNVNGPAQVSYWVRTVHETVGEYIFHRNGQQVLPRLVETSGAWTRLTVEIPGGPQTLRWTAIGGNTQSSPMIAGIDGIEIVPYGLPTFVTPPLLHVPANYPLSEVVKFSPTLVQISVADLPAWLTWDPLQMRLSGHAPMTAADFVVNFTVANDLGAALLPVTIRVTPTFAEALNSPGITWDVSGSSIALWFAQSAVTHDGQIALQSGNVGHNEKSTLRTTIHGPGVLTFWWKCSSSVGDELDFRVDSDTLAELTGETDWEFYTYQVPAGLHSIHFRYEKDEADTQGQDAGGLDQVSFVPTAFDSWIRLRQATQLIEPEADSDGDGVANLVEYAFQTDPAAKDAVKLPTPSREANGQLCWEITKPASVPADVTWTMETSPDLASGSWSTAGVEIVENSAAKIKARIPTTDAGRRFLRLRVVLP